MRVSQPGNNPVQNTEVAGAKSTSRSEAAAAMQKGKKLDKTTTTDTGSVRAELSSKGKEFATAKAAANAAPDVREEKIATLKRMIAAKEYKVDADAVADRMVDDHLKTGIG